ncbi:MAG: hypothetical protein WA975_21530 [Mesorhizobium sp.]
MAEPDPWKEEFDQYMVDVHNTAANSFWPSIAIACALCDKGVIDKGRLLDITEAIIGYLRAEETGALAEVDETIQPLVLFRHNLEQLRLEPGRVLDELHMIEAGAAALAIRRVRNSKRER